MSIEIKNPANPNEIVASHTENTADEIDTIITNAKSAQKKWATIPQPERGRIIKLFLDALEASSEEIALSMTKEMGKTLGESKGEITKAVVKAAPPQIVLAHQLAKFYLHKSQEPLAIPFVAHGVLY